jgi:hypothetical protein
LKNCLDKTIARIPACDQVTELNELAELKTLYNTIAVIARLTCKHAENRVGISAIGGVEAAVKVIKTFPKCQALQLYACISLVNLACCSLGKTNAIESDGPELLLAARNNHLGSAIVCQNACSAQFHIIEERKESTGLLISLGGGTAVAKVRPKWADDSNVQTPLRKLANLFVAEMKAWADDE